MILRIILVLFLSLQIFWGGVILCHQSPKSTHPNEPVGIVLQAQDSFPQFDLTISCIPGHLDKNFIGTLANTMVKIRSKCMRLLDIKNTASTTFHVDFQVKGGRTQVASSRGARVPFESCLMSNLNGKHPFIGAPAGRKCSMVIHVVPPKISPDK